MMINTFFHRNRNATISEQAIDWICDLTGKSNAQVRRELSLRLYGVDDPTKLVKFVPDPAAREMALARSRLGPMKGTVKEKVLTLFTTMPVPRLTFSQISALAEVPMNQVGPALSRLIKDGLVTRVARKTYEKCK